MCGKKYALKNIIQKNILISPKNTSYFERRGSCQDEMPTQKYRHEMEEKSAHLALILIMKVVYEHIFACISFKMGLQSALLRRKRSNSVSSRFFPRFKSLAF